MKTCTRVLAVFLLLFSTFASAQSKPVRLRFMSYDIDPKNPKNITVSINNLETSRTHFIEIGAILPGTKWIVKSFDQMQIPGVGGVSQDRSEIVLENPTTKATLVLPLNKVVESPVSQ